MRETIAASSYEFANPTSACNRRCRRHGAARVKGLEQVSAQTLRQFRSHAITKRNTRMARSGGTQKERGRTPRWNRPPKVRATSALYRSHAARHHRFTRVMNCQGSESTYLIGTFRVWPVANMIAYQAPTSWLAPLSWSWARCGWRGLIGRTGLLWRTPLRTSNLRRRLPPVPGSLKVTHEH
jgi:hypothetical protein